MLSPDITVISDSGNPGDDEGYPNNGNPDDDDSNAPTVTVIPTKPSIKLEKSSVLSQDGNIITYTFTVTNTGNVTLNNVNIVDEKLFVSTRPRKLQNTFIKKVIQKLLNKIRVKIM